MALLNDEIVGILFVLINAGLATWTHLIVEEKYRGTGIGRQLIEYNLNELSRAGVDEIDIIAIPIKLNITRISAFKSQKRSYVMR